MSDTIRLSGVTVNAPEAAAQTLMLDGPPAGDRPDGSPREAVTEGTGSA